MQAHNLEELKTKAKSSRQKALVALLLFWQENRLELEPAAAFSRPEEVSLYRLLVLRSVRHLAATDWLLEKLAERKLQKLDLEVRAAFHLGITQLAEEERVPAHAALKETVDLMPFCRKPQLTGLLNALLRRYQREKESWLHALGQEPLWRQTSHPKWLAQRWQELYGAKTTQSILQADQCPPGIALVVNPRLDPAPFIRSLADQGFRPLENPLRVEEAHGLFETPAFKEGAFFIQDPSAHKLIQLLQDLPKANWLDACAAPGGKLFAAEWLYGREIERLVGLEPEKGRFARLEANHRRLGSKARLVMGDALSWTDREKFDLILVDAPCSATGTIRKHPEIKWTRDLEGFMANQKTQGKLLASLAPQVNLGGHLVYSTCSLEREENQAVVELFLRSHPDFALAPFRAGLEITPSGFYQALPSPLQMGAFAAQLKRVNL